MLLDVVADRLSSMKPAEGAGDGRRRDDSGPVRVGRPPGRTRPSAVGAGCVLHRLPAVPVRRDAARRAAGGHRSKLVDGALLIVRTLRSLIPEADGGAADGAPPARSASRPQPPARRGGLEHIDIS